MPQTLHSFSRTFSFELESLYYYFKLHLGYFIRIIPGPSKSSFEFLPCSLCALEFAITCMEIICFI